MWWYRVVELIQQLSLPPPLRDAGSKPVPTDLRRFFYCHPDRFRRAFTHHNVLSHTFRRERFNVNQYPATI
jgi:hypothetical protein